MAGPFDIQRVPAGLQNLLNLFGPGVPPQLSPQVYGVLELLQFYGLQQRQTLFTNNGAVAVNGNVDVALGPLIGPNNWAVLFAATATVLKTATMTNARVSLNIQRGASGNFQTYTSGDAQPYGATVAGAADFPFVPAFPLLLPPQSTIRTALKALGTDATANVTTACEIGVFG